MKRFVAGMFMSMALVSSVAWAEARGANQVRFQNLTDDQCFVFVNGVYRGMSAPGVMTAWFATNRNNIDPMNVFVQCGDGGMYALQLEAVRDKCVLRFDEEGGGLQAICDDKIIEGSVVSPSPSASAATGKGAQWIQITSLLDDECGIWIQGAYVTRLGPNGSTGWLQGSVDPMQRTNVMLRCSDGGVYANSIEAMYKSCQLIVDEEGAGLRATTCK